MKTKNKIIGGAVLAAAGTLLYFRNRQNIPPKAITIKNFRPEKYTGKWYEIARIDFRYERNMDNTTAEYSLNKNGSITVVNSGYNYKKQKFTTARGIARFVNLPNEGMLKVSFFGPFYAGYNIIAIDRKYRYALVAGRNLNYLWILSRETTIPEDIKESYLQQARSIGYNTDRLVWPNHGSCPTGF